MVKCKECGNEISEHATTPCPHCGYPADMQKSDWLAGLVVAIGMVVVIFFMGSLIFG